MESFKCRFCDGEIIFFETAEVFGNKADYDICIKCGSLQISDAPWLSIAHTTGTSNTDTGAASRSISVSKIVIAFFNYNTI